MNKNINTILLIASLAVTQTLLAANELNCPPSGTAANMTAYRDSVVESILSGDYAKANSSLQRCVNGLQVSCLSDAEYYLNLKRNPSMGRSAPETDPPGSRPVEGFTIKSVNDLPVPFRAENGQIKIPDNLAQVSQRNGWKTVSYKTRSTGGFDTAPNLTLIAVPGQDKDIFLQISPPPADHVDYYNPEPQIRGGNIAQAQDVLTVITLDKTKNPPVGQLRLLEKDINTGNFKWSDRLHSRSCTGCHTSPLRTISPVGYLTTNGSEQRMNPRTEETITEINEMMTGQASWGAYETSSGQVMRRGPPIESQPYGWAPQRSPTRTEEYLKSCSTQQTNFEFSAFGQYTYSSSMTSNPPINYGKLQNAMNCAYCHNGNVRGKLHADFSFNEMVFKVLVDKSMPPGEDLNQNERMALLNCMRAEFRAVSGKWRESGEWMKSAACTDQVNYRSTGASAALPTNRGGDNLRRININSGNYSPAPPIKTNTSQ